MTAPFACRVAAAVRLHLPKLLITVLTLGMLALLGATWVRMQPAVQQVQSTGQGGLRFSENSNSHEIRALVSRPSLDLTWEMTRAAAASGSLQLLSAQKQPAAPIAVEAIVPHIQQRESTCARVRWDEPSWTQNRRLCKYADTNDTLHIFIVHVGDPRGQTADEEAQARGLARLRTVLCDVLVHTQAHVTFHIMIDNNLAIWGLPSHDTVVQALPACSAPGAELLPSCCYRFYSMQMFHQYNILFNTIKRTFADASSAVDGVTGIWLTKALLFELLPTAVPSVVSLDADMRIGGDLASLVAEAVPRMRRDGASMGLVREMMPTYQHFGLADAGYNGGLQLHDLQSMRMPGNAYVAALRSFRWPGEKLPHMHVGALYGDQTLYTLLAAEQPSLIFPISCIWNRQMCRGWFQRHLPGSYGLPEVTERQWCRYEAAAVCPEVLALGVRIVHGSCGNMRPDSAELRGTWLEWTSYHQSAELAAIRALQPC